MMDDDEAFARRLQQQLLDEERMLMEQEQARAQQQQQQQHHHHQRSISVAAAAPAPPPPPPASSSFSNQQYYPSSGGGGARNEQFMFDDHAYALRLQQEGFDKEEEDMSNAIKAAPAPNAYRISQTIGSGLKSSSSMSPRQDSHVDSDAELARRLQEMEAMDQDGVGRGEDPMSSSSFAKANANRRTQEEDDARLARMLAENGGSFSNLDLSFTEPEGKSNQQNDLRQDESGILTSSEQMKPPPTSVAAAASNHTANNHADISFSPNVGYGRSVSLGDSNRPEMKVDLEGDRTAQIYGRSQSYEPATPSFGSSSRPNDNGPDLSNQEPRQPRSISPYRSSDHRPFQPQSRDSSGNAARLSPTRNQANNRNHMNSEIPFPTNPTSDSSNINQPGFRSGTRSTSPMPCSPMRHPSNYDPSPLNHGPLGEPLAPMPGLKPPPRASNNDPADLLPGDAMLDVPSDGKKQKKKRGLLKKVFGGGKGNKPTGSTSLESAPTSNGTGNAPMVSPIRRPFRKQQGPSDTTPPLEASSEISNSNSQRSTSASTTVQQESEEMVVRFPLPKPVPRPADTIGAPTGPLPYSLNICREAPQAPEVTIGKKPQFGLLRTSATCSVCHQPAQDPITALDKKYHVGCFRCTSCRGMINPAGPFAYVENNGDKQPMHRECYNELFGIKCVVCKHAIPAGPNGKVSFVKHPFFDTEQMCPRHAKSLTRRCTGCHRFEPEDEPFADLNDVGRCCCLSCCRTVIVDSNDAQPIWAEVIEFFEKKLNLPIWKDFREIPILVVGYNALNDQMNQVSSVHLGASNIMTRGLCLTEHESGRRFRMNRMRYDSDDGSFVPADVEERGFTFFQVPDASKVNPDASVTAILCLSGLPHDLAASVLAHEATHAWIKLHPRFQFEKPIPPHVEEGCCQLIAHLFLNNGLPDPAPLENSDGSGPSDEKLRQYFKFSIETDDSPIYGDGYREAARIYSHIGIEALMSHLILYQKFPTI